MADFSGGPGFSAFVATFILVTAAVLLFRSLNKHLRKVRTQEPGPTLDAGDGDGDGGVVAEEAGDR